MSEESRIAGTHVESEVPPDQGINIGSADLKDVKDGDTVNLMVRRPNQIKAVDQSFKVSRQPGGGLLLTPVDVPSEENKERRRQLAKAIVASHAKEIMEQALVATEEALARKPEEKLTKMKEQGDKGEKATMKTRKGCMSLAVGGEEVIL